MFSTSLGLAGLTLWSAPRLVAKLRPRVQDPASTLLALFAGLLSSLVSYGFFQDDLWRWMKHFAYRMSSSYGGDGNTVPDTLVSHVMAWLSQYMLAIAHGLQERTILGTEPWLRLALPEVGVFVVALLVFAVARGGRTRPVTRGDRGVATGP